jgi:hypothetical protein
VKKRSRDRGAGSGPLTATGSGILSSTCARALGQEYEVTAWQQPSHWLESYRHRTRHEGRFQRQEQGGGLVHRFIAQDKRD